MSAQDTSTPIAPGFFGLGALDEIERDPLGFFVRVAARGDAVAFRIGPFDVVQLTHPAHNREVLVEKHRSFRKSRRVKRVLAQWSGDGLALIDGEPWVRLRRLVNPAFRAEVTAGHLSIVERRAEELAAGWAQRGELDVSPDLHRLTFAVVAEAVFGSDVEPYLDDFALIVAELNRHAIRELSALVVLPMWMPTPAKRSLRRAAARLREVVFEMIARARARMSRGSATDLLSMLLDVEDDDGTRLTDEQVHDAAVNLLLGATETTATAIVWTLHCLANDRAAQDDAAAEVLARAPGPSMSNAQLLSLEHVDASLKEAMRLYPPAYALPREAAEDVVVGGLAIPAGAMVNLVPYVTHRDPRWFVEPERFSPARFRDARFPAGAYLPFGLGPRACIGRGFAMMEAVAALAGLLRRFRFHPIGEAREPVLEAQISLHPKDGLRLALEPRGPRTLA